MLCRRLVPEPHILLSPEGTLSTPLLSCVLPSCERAFSSGVNSSDRKMSSYKEILRSGLVDIKKDDAVELFRSMIRSRPLPTVIDFNRLFGLVAKTKPQDLVLGLCKQMELQGIGYDLYTQHYDQLLLQESKTRFFFSVMGKILKLGYEPNTVTFSTLINGSCLKDLVSQDVELVYRMVELKVTPHLLILNTLVNGIQGRVSEAMVLIDRMTPNGCQPDVFTYGPVLNMMCKSGNTALALDLLRNMEARKIKLDVVTYTTTVNSLCKDGSLDDAVSFCNETETKGIKADVFTYNSLIGGFCAAGRWDDDAQFLRDMITKEISLNIVTFNTLIDSFVKGGKLTEAKELYNEMITRGIDPNTITYNSLYMGCA